MAGVASGSIGALLSGGGKPTGGGVQIIGGKQYNMYSPEWYAAMDAQKIRDARTAGTAAGTQAGAGVTALRDSVPDLFGPNTSSSTSSTGATSGAAPSVPRVSMGGTPSAPQLAPAAPVPTGLPTGYAVAPAPTLRTVDTSAAEDARFNRAKDRVGESTRAALTGLRSTLASRGQLGGAGESHGTSALFTKGLSELGDVSRQEAITGAELDQANAALEFQGGLTTRGQDLSAAAAANALAARLREVAYQGEITQRGQDLAAARDEQTFAAEEKRAQQATLDRILAALTPLY